MNNLDKNDLPNIIYKMPNFPIQGYDRNRNVIYWNEASEKLYGYTKEEALGKKLEDLIVHDYMKDEVVKDIQNWYTNNVPVPSGEITLKHKNGNDIYVYSSHIMVDEKTDFPKMFCLDMDLSSEKKKEEKLNNFFELAINLQVIASMDGKVLQINNAVKTILGYEKEDVVNSSFLDIVHPDDIDKTISEMKKLANGEKVYYFENRYRHKDGHYVYLAWSASTNKTNTQIYASAQDISSVKRIEAEKKKQDRILLQQSKTAAVGEMIGNIAHQWRQPLSIISTASTGLKLSFEMGGTLDNSLVLETLDNINQHTQYLSDTIDDFRNFFRDDFVTIKNNNLKETLKKVRSLTIDSFNSNFIEYYEECKDMQFEYNENVLVQALLNIYNNSKDALLNKDEHKYFFINVEKTKDSIIITTKDSAGGIKENIINKVFEPYFTTKHESIGTGIGLYMTHQIITKQLHGKISVNNATYAYNNATQIGAEFTIVIPI